MKCKLSEFGECEREFTPLKEWGEFCCTQHRKRWHYLNRKHEAVEDAEVRRDERLNGHANGHAPVKLAKKLDLVALGLAPKAPPIKRRKFKADVEQRAKAEERA
jgi:hypothetical protein